MSAAAHEAPHLQCHLNESLLARPLHQYPPHQVQDPLLFLVSGVEKKRKEGEPQERRWRQEQKEHRRWPCQG